MHRRLPPLNAVKAFEATGRRGSLTLAASELGVTHGAISRQIRILESWLGASLFARDGRGVALTAEGQQFLIETTRVLDDLARASEQLAGRDAREVLRISAPQTFTMRWLIPRLPRFTSQHPDIEIRLSASIEPLETLCEHFDLAIRRGHLGETSTAFLSETCLPVASPDLLAKRPVGQVADLAAHTLLHAESVASLWALWLREAGMPDLAGAAQLRFEPLYHSLQAAIDGVGIAMGPSALVAADVAAGRLTPLFPQLALRMEDFHVVISRTCHSVRHARLFQTWLLQEGQSSGSQAPA
ncbi:LysR substrate-binding domain-containing protein [Rhizobium straminoryzae]|uniref:LysR family transcriptional regulator n=1 Tax=Rhizobium straminoryzae TaxID=1387186 RepID=A0A549TIH1_9HYPH|nr:LysR substrate-binding domain-containing protein [Rhizobium straminoryzae]TRL43041.1 LysR family transcriptional regulator [Rhizobium straminoryzae]